MTIFLIIVETFYLLASGLVFLNCRVNTLVCSVLLWSNKCNNPNNAENTPLIPVLAGRNLHISQNPSHKWRDPWPTNCTPRTPMLRGFFFSILPELHMQVTFALVLSFEVGHFARHFLFFSSFWFCYERNSSHAVSMSHFISLVRLAHHLFFYYPTGDGYWIHVNVGCSAGIYSTHSLSLWTKNPG